MTIILDHKGMREMLKSDEVRAEVLRLANGVAQELTVTIDGKHPEIKTGTYTTDRAAAGVTIAHPAALLVEAREGVLARAASAVGLEVKAKK